ncbi:MAG TPA: hypothetical protein V6C99_04625, partial [Oculatellaceae cyanobacterium]
HIHCGRTFGTVINGIRAMPLDCFAFPDDIPSPNGPVDPIGAIVPRIQNPSWRALPQIKQIKIHPKDFG